MTNIIDVLQDTKVTMSMFEFLLYSFLYYAVGTFIMLSSVLLMTKQIDSIYEQAKSAERASREQESEKRHEGDVRRDNLPVKTRGYNLFGFKRSKN